jgi:hypothetical protein
VLPIVGLAVHSDTGLPVLAAARLRETLDPRVNIYLISDLSLRQLRQRLGSGLALDDGTARIWWPGINPESDPADHPVVHPCDAGTEGEALEAFALALDRTRPRVRQHITAIQDSAARTARRLDETWKEFRATREELQRANQDAQTAEEARDQAERQITVLRAADLNVTELEMVARMDSEEVMHRLISREWIAALTASDRLQHPLGAYVFGPEFLQTVESRRNATPRERVAFACAMIASGWAGKLAGLEPHQLRGHLGSDTPQERRSDGAKAWMCNLGHGRGATRLQYWVIPDRKIEFAALRTHDELGRI